MTFEEAKEIFKKSIDTSDTINQVIENFIQSIYAKGYDDALNNILAPEIIEEQKSASDAPQRDCVDCRFDLLNIDDHPCCSCYYKDEKPCFRPIERSAPVNGKEGTNDNRMQ